MRGSNVDGTTKFRARTFYKADFSGATLHRVKGYKGKFNFTKWENATIKKFLRLQTQGSTRRILME